MGLRVVKDSCFLDEILCCFELDQGNESTKRVRFFFKLGTRTLEYLPKGADAI